MLNIHGVKLAYPWCNVKESEFHKKSVFFNEKEHFPYSPLSHPHRYPSIIPLYPIIPRL